MVHSLGRNIALSHAQSGKDPCSLPHAAETLSLVSSCFSKQEASNSFVLWPQINKNRISIELHDLNYKNPRRKAHAYMCVYVFSFFEGLLRMGKGGWDGALTHPVTYNDAFKILTVITSPWSKLHITHTSK